MGDIVCVKEQSMLIPKQENKGDKKTSLLHVLTSSQLLSLDPDVTTVTGLKKVDAVIAYSSFLSEKSISLNVTVLDRRQDENCQTKSSPKL